MAGPVFPDPPLGKLGTTDQSEPAVRLFAKAQLTRDFGRSVGGMVIEQDDLAHRRFLRLKRGEAGADPPLFISCRDKDRDILRPGEIPRGARKRFEAPQQAHVQEALQETYPKQWDRHPGEEIPDQWQEKLLHGIKPTTQSVGTGG